MQKIEKRRIAVILTCYNRKTKTVSCIKRLAEIGQSSSWHIEIFLTDDGSTDGTVEGLLSLNLDISMHILKGDGNLFWARGMNLAWSNALKVASFDGYLWLNDDTILYDTIFDEIEFTDYYSLHNYKKRGVYVGSTRSTDTETFTYGGHFYKNRLLNTLGDIIPNKDIQNCEIANGNIAYVSKDVVDVLGIFHNGYIHGADYDYTYLAYKKNFPVLVMRGYLGECNNDHQSEGYVKFKSLSFKERINYLYSPKGLQFGGALLFQRRFFPYRYPLVLCAGWFKLFFPKLYCFLNKLR